ncbi:MAG: hypothetical protein KDJ50_09255 [Alphaproteobacteria bacterium]|nr:hypothetical protein [Alphaproteobacteria bacterium]
MNEAAQQPENPVFLKEVWEIVTTCFDERPIIQKMFVEHEVEAKQALTNLVIAFDDALERIKASAKPNSSSPFGISWDKDVEKREAAKFGATQATTVEKLFALIKDKIENDETLEKMKGTNTFVFSFPKGTNVASGVHIADPELLAQGLLERSLPFNEAVAYIYREYIKDGVRVFMGLLSQVRERQPFFQHEIVQPPTNT